MKVYITDIEYDIAAGDDPEDFVDLPTEITVDIDVDDLDPGVESDWDEICDKALDAASDFSISSSNISL